jgi:hypothetical protein
LSLNLPRPGQTYSPIDEAQTRQAIAAADRRNVKKSDNIVIDPNKNKLILIDADGVQWSVTVATDGTISAASS